MNKTIITELARIQQELKAPKNQTNTFGGYKYRSCEDILEAVKPLLQTKGLSLILNDTIVGVEGRFYVQATATLTNGEESISATACAREAEEKKGMDASQITGATSSYARKYALNGLFAIDDAKDADTQDNRQKTTSQPVKTAAKAVGIDEGLDQAVKLDNAVKSKCELCGASGKYHKPGCPNGGTK